MQDILLRQDIGAVTRLTLNSPANFNALSDAMLDRLTNALTELSTANATRVIVLAANGKAFCAGHDLREMQSSRNTPDQGRAGFEDLFARCSRLMQLLPALPQPVIAEIHGIATAAGTQLVASCDLAVAAENVRFGVNGVDIGLFCSTPMVALTRAIPRKAAFEMLTTGDFIPAERARELGLVNHVVPAAELTDRTMELANRIATKLPAAIRMGKQAFYDQLQRGLSDAYTNAGATMCENILLPDTAEGMAAFLEKRPPNWS